MAREKIQNVVPCPTGVQLSSFMARFLHWLPGLPSDDLVWNFSHPLELLFIRPGIFKWLLSSHFVLESILLSKTRGWYALQLQNPLNAVCQCCMLDLVAAGVHRRTKYQNLVSILYFEPPNVSNIRCTSYLSNSKCDNWNVWSVLIFSVLAGTAASGKTTLSCGMPYM